MDLRVSGSWVPPVPMALLALRACRACQRRRGRKAWWVPTVRRVLRVQMGAMEFLAELVCQGAMVAMLAATTHVSDATATAIVRMEGRS